MTDQEKTFSSPTSTPSEAGHQSSDLAITRLAIGESGTQILECNAVAAELLHLPPDTPLPKSSTHLLPAPLLAFLSSQVSKTFSVQATAHHWQYPIHTSVCTSKGCWLPVQVLAISKASATDVLVATVQWAREPDSSAVPDQDPAAAGGILLVDQDSQVQLFDHGAYHISLASSGQPPHVGVSLLTLFPGLARSHVQSAYRRVSTHGIVATLPLSASSPDELIYAVTLIPLEDGNVLASFRPLSHRNRQIALTAQRDDLLFLASFASSTAHNLANYLTELQGAVDSLRSDLSKPRRPRERLHHHLTKVERVVQFMQETVEPLAWELHSGDGAVQATPVQLDDVVTDALVIARRRWLDRNRQNVAVDLTEHLGHPLPILIHPGTLRDSIINLLINAFDALPSGGAITVTTEAIREEEDLGWAKLTVADTGIGMNLEIRSRLFQPLFTTKRLGRGTGIGLVSLQHTVLLVGGSIEVQSRPGVGTRFVVLLPTAQHVEAIDPSQPHPQVTIPPSTFLYVEDDYGLRDVMTESLQRSGHSVVTAGSCTEAHQTFAAARTEHATFDAIILDISLPDGSGWNLAAELRSLGCHAPIIITSGWALREQDAPYPSALAPYTILRKPYRAQGLLKVFAQLSER
ncbi:MAG: hybrid sensor histidine kinase/response regulator [Chloroflexi bacterium]|nr:hybrid sensor histidine kinase/response regulator [Chloroflexota bacterium]